MSKVQINFAPISGGRKFSDLRGGDYFVFVEEPGELLQRTYPTDVGSGPFRYVGSGIYPFEKWADVIHKPVILMDVSMTAAQAAD